MKKQRYEFNKERHLHLLDGKALTGCTTILSVVAKPALIQWSANMAVDYVKEKLCPGWDNTKSWLWLKETIELVFKEAKSAHRKKKEKAGEWGTKTHEIIEEIINDVIDNSGGIVRSGKNSNPAVQNFIDWAIKNKVKFLESEKGIYSETLWIGGIVDFVCEIDGKVWIGDIKTAKSGIWAENFWQCAGYDLMLKDMGLYPKVAGYLILNLKESGEMIEKRSISNGDNTKAFLACLDIYRIKEKITNQVI